MSEPTSDAWTSGDGRVAVVTGANQGLGLAVVAALRRRLGPDAAVYLTGRDRARVQAAAARLRAEGLAVVPELLDVRADADVERFAALLRDRHGGVDIVVSNAAARITPDATMAEQVRAFVDTNNRGTTRLLRALLPLLRPRGRYLVVASSFGTLRELDPSLHARFGTPGLTLDDLDATMDAYAAAVEAGRDGDEGWPAWINVPSKVGQVAAARIAARTVCADGPPGAFVAAACPGLVDTDASRPWFTDMTEAQRPEEAAAHLVRLMLDPVGDDLAGELVQFGRVLPWR
ncbi:MAG TPA: SDR family NAD(P)-dependent oxidoreductase [Acidimicrobiales bacterium]|nr:SDR family NAD(P)-dependent oxidoreductase [Acidimicrobiales bacterium]